MSDDDDETGGLGISLEMLTSLSLSLSGLSTEVKRLNDRNSRRLEALPRNIALIQQSTSATAVDLLDFGAPAPGRQWEVRILGVISATGAGFIAMATTFSTWYVGQKMTGNAPGILPLSGVRWQFPSVPNFKDLSGDVMKVLPAEHLYAGLTGIPAAPTQIMGIAVVNDVPLYAGRPSVDV